MTMTQSKRSNKIGVNDVIYHDKPLKTWMSDLSYHKRCIPVIYLAIPGSHNTFSYSISKNSDVSPDSPDIVQRLSHWAKRIVNPIIYKWSRTQEVDIKDQLEGGIRYLDIRVASRDDTLYVAHGLYGGALKPFLQQIAEFLAENAREVVILDFQHFYECTVQDHHALIAMLDVIFGPRLCQRVRDIRTVSVESMTSNGEQVLVVYRCNAARDSPLIWPSGVWPTPWPDKLKVNDLIEYLNLELEKRNGKIGLVTQCLLTVDTAYVIKHPFGSLTTMAAKTNRKMLPWVETQLPGHSGINVVICDFVHSFDFAKTIVQLNYTDDTQEEGLHLKV